MSSKNGIFGSSASGLIFWSLHLRTDFAWDVLQKQFASKPCPLLLCHWDSDFAWEVLPKWLLRLFMCCWDGDVARGVGIIIFGDRIIYKKASSALRLLAFFLERAPRGAISCGIPFKHVFLGSSDWLHSLESAFISCTGRPSSMYMSSPHDIGRESWLLEEQEAV